METIGWLLFGHNITVHQLIRQFGGVAGWVLLGSVTVLALFAACSYIENRRIWNGGTCAANGLPWEVLSGFDGTWLKAGNEYRRVGCIIPTGIHQASRQARRAK